MKAGCCIYGKWIEGKGEEIVSTDPATGEVIWSGRSASAEQVADAVEAARRARGAWATATIEKRIEVLNAFAGQLAQNRAELAELISRETGKPIWESLGEVDSM